MPSDNPRHRPGGRSVSPSPSRVARLDRVETRSDKPSSNQLVAASSGSPSSRISSRLPEASLGNNHNNNSNQLLEGSLASLKISNNLRLEDCLASLRISSSLRLGVYLDRIRISSSNLPLGDCLASLRISNLPPEADYSASPRLSQQRVAACSDNNNNNQHRAEAYLDRTISKPVVGCSVHLSRISSQQHPGAVCLVPPRFLAPPSPRNQVLVCSVGTTISSPSNQIYLATIRPTRIHYSHLTIMLRVLCLARSPNSSRERFHIAAYHSTENYRLGFV